MYGKRKRTSAGPRRAVKRVYRKSAKTSKSKSKVQKYKRQTKSWINNDSGTSKSICVVKKPTKLSIYSKHIKWAENPQVKEILRFGTIATFNNDAIPVYINGIQAAGTTEPKFNKDNIVELQRILGGRGLNQNAVFTATSVPDFRTQQTAMKIFLESVEQTLTLTNMTTGNIIVNIYDCVFKKDCNLEQDVLTLWDNGQRVEQAGNEIVLQQVARGFKRPFATPYNSELFKQYVTVKKRTEIELPQGRNHRHVFIHRPNRMFSMAQLAEFGNTELNAFRGLTSQTLVVIRGNPVLVGGIDNNRASLAKCSVAWVENTKYRWRIAVQNPTYYDTEGALVDGFGGTTNAFVVSEGAGDAILLETAGTLA